MLWASITGVTQQHTKTVDIVTKHCILLPGVGSNLEVSMALVSRLSIVQIPMAAHLAFCQWIYDATVFTDKIGLVSQKKGIPHFHDSTHLIGYICSLLACLQMLRKQTLGAVHQLLRYVWEHFFPRDLGVFLSRQMTY